MTVPGHPQRGGSPCPYDRAPDLVPQQHSIMDEDYGNMIAMINGRQSAPLGEVAGKLKTVDPGIAR